MSDQIYFDDLTNYTYQIAPFILDAVKNVGWLNLSSKFPTENVPVPILDKLKMIAGGIGMF